MFTFSVLSFSLGGQELQVWRQELFGLIYQHLAVLFFSYPFVSDSVAFMLIPTGEREREGFRLYTFMSPITSFEWFWCGFSGHALKPLFFSLVLASSQKHSFAATICEFQRTG